MKIFVVSPASIIGEMIIKGIARGFEALGVEVLLFDIREIDFEKVSAFNPDFVFGMDYFHYMQKDVEDFVESLDVPTVHYFIDDPKSVFAHGGCTDFLDKLNNKKNKVVFSWDKNFLSDFKDGAIYLSTGIDFELYNTPSSIVMPPSKLLFAGRPLTDRREYIIATIIKHFGDILSIYCYAPHFEQSIKNMQEKGFLSPQEIELYKACYKGFLKDEKELAATYYSADMILNITLDQGPCSMNSRVLEALATGSFLITDYVEDTAKYFEDKKDLILYRNNAELIDFIEYYKDNDVAKNQIRGNAIQKIKQNHTLQSRAVIILEYLKNAYIV